VCGIVGIVCENVEPIGKMLRRCLERLEYRGYDSAGIAIIDSTGTLIIRKGKGKIAELNRKLKFDEVYGKIGIGHTRWATHGKPSDENAHPHFDCTRSIAVVHNGIIANYLEIREKLESSGHRFTSETDTEVIAHLVEEYSKRYEVFEAFKKAIQDIEGTYAIALITSLDSSKLFFARQTSPLVVGIGNGMNIVASDIPAVLEYTNRIIVLKDGEVGYVTPREVYIERDGKVVDWKERVRVISWSLDMASKGGYPHFMLKEIHEQPLALSNTLSGIEMENIREICMQLLKADRIFITGAGTSYHAGLVGEYLLSELAQIPVNTFIASEYRKYVNVATDRSILIAISQSGETIDTLMAVRAFKSRGCKVVAISNVVDSTIPRESDNVIYTRAGPEIGVAATKTFTTQIMVLTVLSLTLAYLRESLSEYEYKMLMRELQNIPNIVETIIRIHEPRCITLARYMKNKTNAFYLGRGLGVPIAMEGALKLKEIAYIHAESYPAGESKHGPIALVERDFPVLFVVLDDYYVDAIVGNVMEMKARDAYTIALVPKKYSLKFGKLCDYIIDMPNIDYRLAPIPYIVPLQLLAYYTSVMRGLDPDKPRNLAKTVTVE